VRQGQSTTKHQKEEMPLMQRTEAVHEKKKENKKSKQGTNNKKKTTTTKKELQRSRLQRHRCFPLRPPPRLMRDVPHLS
jgi:hypothetical protein